MAEYIEREAAIYRLEKLFQLQAPTARAIVEAIPSADVAPVRHGRWREGVYAGYKCSECRTTWDAPTNFCPNCGCRMDLEDNDGR